MDSVPGLSLLRQAHCEGRIDLRDAEPLDRRWWKKVLWTLQWVEKENCNRIHDMKYRLHCSLLNYLSSEQQFNLHWDRAVHYVKKIINNLFPYLRLDDEPAKENIERMIAEWKRIWGDPKDPKVAAEIQRTVEHLLSMTPRGRRTGKK